MGVHCNASYSIVLEANSAIIGCCGWHHCDKSILNLNRTINITSVRSAIENSNEIWLKLVK